MDNKDVLKSIYDDFFGEEKKQATQTNIEISNEKENMEEQERNFKLDSSKIIEEQNRMALLVEEIEKLYITEESKLTMKKIVEYMYKYNENIEKHYIPFNMCVYSDNDETILKITQILSKAIKNYSYIKKQNINATEISLYNLEKPEQIDQVYKDENSIILIKDFEAINTQNESFKNIFLHKLESQIEEHLQSFITIIISKDKETINYTFEKNEKIKQTIFDFEIYGIKPIVQEVYQEVLEKLKEATKVSDEVSIKLLDYISATYPKTTIPEPEYREQLCKKILFNKGEELTVEDLPEYEKDKTIEEVFEELNELVGLEKVKKVLIELVDLIELKNKTQEQLKIKDTNLHMVFLGNPGTGKTTVARLVAQILYNLKYIKQNKLIEVSSKDLVAEYVGQTAPKTMSVIERALGGVLFIDEAYSLASGQGQGSSYNEEAIATLIQAMENNRDNLVVIFAGYTKEMQAFLESNSGIVSRIGYTLEFEDYTETQLLQIFENMMKKSGFILTQEAKDEVLKVIKEYKNTKNFGNARFVRNLYEKTIIKHASNTKGKKQKQPLITIQKQDINTEHLLKM